MKFAVWCTQRNLFQILLNYTQIRLYLPFSDSFGTRQTSVWSQISRWMENTIWFMFDWIRFGEYFSVCGAEVKWIFCGGFSATLREKEQLQCPPGRKGRNRKEKFNTIIFKWNEVNNHKENFIYGHNRFKFTPGRRGRKMKKKFNYNHIRFKSNRSLALFKTNQILITPTYCLRKWV